MERSNTSVKKLWMLARNGVLSYETVKNIFKNEEDGFIVFNSKRSYEKFKEHEFSASAMSPM